MGIGGAGLLFDSHVFVFFASVNNAVGKIRRGGYV